MFSYLTLGTNNLPRGDSFYGGYFPVLDGNKIAVCYIS